MYNAFITWCFRYFILYLTEVTCKLNTVQNGLHTLDYLCVFNYCYVFTTVIICHASTRDRCFSFPRYCSRSQHRLEGSSIYDVHKKIRFLTPLLPLSTWAGPPSPPCGRPHTVDMKYTPLS